MESLEARLVPLLVEKTHLLARIRIAGAPAVDLGPFAGQCETFCNCSSKACVQRFSYMRTTLRLSEECWEGSKPRTVLLQRITQSSKQLRGHVRGKVSSCTSVSAIKSLFWIGSLIVFAPLWLSFQAQLLLKLKTEQ